MIPISPNRRSSSPQRTDKLMKTYCYVQDATKELSPKEQSNLVDQKQWEVEQLTLHVRDTSNYDQTKPMSFQFDELFQGSTSFHNAAFYAGISPLIRQVIAGEDCIALFCGPAAMNIPSYLLSSANSARVDGSQHAIPGLLTQAASQLLLAANSVSGERKATITLSWYRIDCSTSESILDILRIASDSKLAKETPAGIIATNSEQLIMREQGRGRGMVIPGLWEVELATTNDIEAVIQHVLRLVVAADHNRGGAHTIFQLTYATTNTMDSSMPALSGRISFAVLSDLLSSTSSSIVDNDMINTYAWVQHLLLVMDWIDQKHAAPPFHKSRLLLLLRDLLCGRQDGVCYFMCHHPTASQLPHMQQWLQLVNRMRQRPLQPGSISSSMMLPMSNTTSSTTTTSSQQQSQRRSSSVGMRGSESRSSFASTTSKPPLARRSSSISPVPFSSSQTALSLSSTTSSANASAAAPIASHSLSSIFGRANSITSQDAAFAAAAVSSSSGWSQPADMNASITNPPRSPSISISSSTARSQSPTRRSSSPGRRVSIRDALRSVTSNDRSGSLSPLHAALKRHDSITSNSFHNNNSSYIQHEEFMMLKSAFDAIQDENTSQRHQIAQLQVQVEDHRDSYQQLINQLQEEGAMLEKKDQTRYRQALQEIRDYDVYKEVMEAAMVRMTKELNDALLENKTLKQQQSMTSIHHRKQQSFEERYTRDLTVTKKKYHDAEQRIANMMVEMKKIMKERDTASSELIALKAEVKRRFDTPASSQQHQHDDNVENQHHPNQQQLDDIALQHIQELEQQVSDMMKSHHDEVSVMKAGHSNALAQVMKYQEENRLLKATVSAMLDAADHPDMHVSSTTSTSQQQHQQPSSSSNRRRASVNTASLVQSSTTSSASNIAPAVAVVGSKPAASRRASTYS